jgi:hypothetical protein
VTFNPPTEWTNPRNQFDVLQDIGSLTSGNVVVKGLVAQAFYDITYFNPDFYEGYPATPFVGPYLLATNNDGELVVPLQTIAGIPILTEEDPFMLVEVKLLDSDFLGRYGSDSIAERKFVRAEQGQPAIELNEQAEVIVFPNPIGESVSLRTFYTQGELEIELHDELGRTIIVWPAQKILNGAIELSVPLLSAGMYNLVCTDRFGDTHHVKLIKL